jgi:hypothetical protein
VWQIGSTLNVANAEACPLRRQSLANYAKGPLAPFLDCTTVFEVGATANLPPAGSQDLVFAAYRLQEIADYRAAIQSWFGGLKIGGQLFIAVPHAFLYERLLVLPGRWNPGQRRLYTPASLLAEVEEALSPNSYRVRWLSDNDDGYDYNLDRESEPLGPADVVLVLERIAAPSWTLVETSAALASAPDYAFEPDRTRVEFVHRTPRTKILILKLDHLGDFIMGIPALQKARASFADSDITLVVGSWNVDIARQLDLADQVRAFDVFPTNASEEVVDLHGKTALFEASFTEDYDLAIDLRTDTDTRFLLKSVRADLRAGIGTRSRFEFLDIALPLDFGRNEPETAREFDFNHHAFASQGSTLRNEFRISTHEERAQTHGAIVWGPYFALRPGAYIFEPFLELDPLSEGLLGIDVALDQKRLIYRIVPAPEGMRLAFKVDKPGALFEFRIWALEDAPQLDFNFYGGRLMRQGASSVLHQSEYLSLLIELITMRFDRFGVLMESTEAE